MVGEYHKLKLDIVELEKKMMAEITRPERVLYFLLPGRLVCDENDHLTNSKLQSESLLISYFFYFNHGKGSVPCFLLLKALKF